MLTYDEALTRILTDVVPLPTEPLSPSQAVGRAIAADITAPENLPPFDNSAVDGYAVRLVDTKRASERAVLLPVAQIISAGDAPTAVLAAGSAARIYTGAPVPAGADAIIMQEDTELLSGGMALLQVPGSAHFIRKAGSDVRTGEVVLTTGETIDAGVVGLLAALGVATVPVCRKPTVALLTTGNEVASTGAVSLATGQIRDANGPALTTAIEAAGATVAVRVHAMDTPQSVRDALAQCATCDVIVSTGGVSVGGADFVKDVLAERGTLAFWRIAIKPGKPLAFGKIGDALFFGLPGNPVSSLVTFELFVRPILRKLQGYHDVLRPRVMATVTEAIPHETGRREFVRVHLVADDDGLTATPTGLQGSHRLSSMVGANGLLIVSEDRGDVIVGERLPAFWLG